MAKKKPDAVNLEERIAQVRSILTGEASNKKLQVYFRNEILARTDAEPSRATVHRWVTGKTARGTNPLALRVLAELEQEARDLLKAQLKDLGK